MDGNNKEKIERFVTEEAGKLGPPDRDPDPVVALAERAHDVSAQKPRSAENRDQSVEIRCHGGPFLPKPAPEAGLYRAGLRCAIGSPRSI